MCLISLKDFAPDLMHTITVPLLELVSRNIDSAMLLLESQKISLALDMLITISAFIKEKEHLWPRSDP
jgi:hypothetical protein